MKKALISLISGLIGVSAFAAESSPDYRALLKQCMAEGRETCRPRLPDAERDCAAGNAGACAYAGSTLLEVGTVPPKYKEALPFLEKACQMKDAYSCMAAGYAYSNLTLPPDDVKARRFDKLGCDLNEHTSCYNLALKYHYGRGVAKDLQKAAQIYEKGCGLDDSDSCSNLGTLLQTGSRPDHGKAASSYEKACALESGYGCMNLGAMYEYGDGLPKDYATAKKYYEKACALENGPGCYNLGTLYYNGFGVRQDRARAKDYYGKACEMGDPIACKTYAGMKNAAF